jgi:hypothetical protein
LITNGLECCIYSPVLCNLALRNSLILNKELCKIVVTMLGYIKTSTYLYYIRMRDMNTTITIFEAIIVSGVSLIGYVFGKTVYETYFKSSK